jgi:hypothetical protein
LANHQPQFPGLSFLLVAFLRFGLEPGQSILGVLDSRLELRPFNQTVLVRID